MIDLNNESAGRETGRIKRFNLPVSDKALNAEKEKDERRFNVLMRLLQDPHYARLYHHAVTVVTAAEEAAEKARRKLEQEGGLAEKRRRELLDKAAQLPDGTKVLQSVENARIYSEHGEDVTHRKDSISGLHPASPKWKEYQHAKKITEEIEKQRHEVETYHREVLDPIKNRLGDTENPATRDELEKIITRVNAKMSPAVRTQHKELNDAGPKPHTTSRTARRQRSCRRLFLNLHKTNRHLAGKHLYTFVEYLFWRVGVNLIWFNGKSAASKKEYCKSCQ